MHLLALLLLVPIIWSRLADLWHVELRTAD